MIYKNVFIIFYFFFFLKIDIFSGSCNCRKIDKNNELNINKNESNIDNNLKDEKIGSFKNLLLNNNILY